MKIIFCLILFYSTFNTSTSFAANISNNFTNYLIANGGWKKSGLKQGDIEPHLVLLSSRQTDTAGKMSLLDAANAYNSYKQRSPKTPVILYQTTQLQLGKLSEPTQKEFFSAIRQVVYDPASQQEFTLGFYDPWVLKTDFDGIHSATKTAIPEALRRFAQKRKE